MKSTLIRLISAILLMLSASLVFGQNTAKADSIAETRTAIMKLENSEQTLYDLYSSTMQLWVSKKKECDDLEKRVNLLLENDSLTSENMRILNAELADKKNELKDLNEKLKKGERKLKIRKIVGRASVFISFALGVYIGSKFL